MALERSGLRAAGVVKTKKAAEAGFAWRLCFRVENCCNYRFGAVFDSDVSLPLQPTSTAGQRTKIAIRRKARTK